MKNKRFLAVILVVLTSHTMMNGTVMGMAEPAYVPEIKYFNDFAADKTYFAGATGYTSLEDSGEEMSGQTLAINPVKDLSYINVNTPMKDGKDFSMSFDFKAQQEDHPLSMFTQESGNVRIAAINYDVKGNLVINSKAGSFPNASGNYSSNINLISTYVGTDWTNITMHFHPDGYNTTIDWYIDGKFIVTSVASNVTSGKNFSGGMDTFHFGTTQSGEGISDTLVIYDGDEQFLIDNFKIEYIDSEYAYSTLKTQVGMETNELEIVFSEPLDAEITPENISVTNIETGESVNVTEVKGSANKTGRMNIVVDGGFTADTEYSINLPENVKGVSGRKLFSDKIYFVPVGVLDVECPTITESILKTNGDCEDLPEGTLESLGKEKGNWTKYLVCDWVYDISAENTGTDEDRNMAICFAPDHTSTQFFRLETEGHENSPFIPDTGKDSIVWSMDVMRKELVRTYPLTFIMGKDNVGAAGVGMFFFDSYGNFVFLNGSGDWWSTDDKDIANGEEYSSKQTAYQAEIEAGEWVNVTAVINSKSETVTYFVDNEYAGTADWPSNRKGKGYNYFSGMRINPEETYRDGRVMYFDNYKLGYAEIESNKKVTSVRMFDRFGNSYAPTEQNVITDIRSISVSFNDRVGDISEAEFTLHDDNGNEVEISNIRTEQEKIIADVDEILEKNTLYYITVSGVKTNDGNEEFKAYESSFNTTPEGEFTVTNFELRDLSGNPISDISEISEGESIILNVSAINTTDEDVYLNASLTAYSNSVIADDEVMELEVGANTRNADVDIEIEVSDTENLYVIATLTDEMKKPVTDAIELGTAVTSVDSWTLVFEGETTPNSKIYAEIQAPEDSVEGFVYRGQLISDEAGKFKVLARVFDNPEIENDAKSGEYVLSWVDENGNKGTKSIGFANVNEEKKIADDIVGFVTNQDKETAIKSIAQILSSENSRYALNITDDIQKDELPVTAEIIYNYVKDGKTEDTSLTINVNKAVCISGVVSGRIENLFDYPEKLELDSSKIAEFYKGSYVTEEVEKSVTAKICGKKITDSQDFYDILEEAFVLAVVENPDGEDNLKKIMNAFHEEIGIVKNGKDKAYREVMYNSYKSYAELKKAFNNANTSSQSGGGSSSGGSGGGSNKSSVSVVGGYVNKNDIQDMQIPYSVFSDIENVAWAKDAIVRLAEMQIINGKGENKFYPNDNITRAEFAKIVVLAFEYKNTSGAESGFSDVPGWAKEYVDNAFANEIVNGYSNEIFGSGDKITRQDLVTMAYRAAVKAGEEYDAQSSNIFSDSAFISDYAKDAVHTLFNAGMINGVGKGEFAPTAFATRAEAAKIIYNMIMN